MSGNDKQNLVRLTGLWRNKNGRGFGGSFGAARLVLLHNDRKRGANDPDLVLFVAPAEKRDAAAAAQDRSVQGTDGALDDIERLF